MMMMTMMMDSTHGRELASYVAKCAFERETDESVAVM